MRKKILFFLIILLPAAVYGQCEGGKDSLSKYEKRILKYQRRWSHFIPKYTKLQFAGGMGMLSGGIGWVYGKKHWETDLLIGFVPEFSGERGYATITLKENYIPWNIKLNRTPKFYDWNLEPFTVSLYINKIFGENFWRTPPQRYPDGYYYMATNMRINIAFGQRINVKMRNPKFNKAIGFFYELGTNDLYILCLVQNKTLKIHDIFSLSLGLRMQIF